MLTSNVNRSASRAYSDALAACSLLLKTAPESGAAWLTVALRLVRLAKTEHWMVSIALVGAPWNESPQLTAQFLQRQLTALAATARTVEGLRLSDEIVEFAESAIRRWRWSPARTVRHSTTAWQQALARELGELELSE